MRVAQNVGGVGIGEYLHAQRLDTRAQHAHTHGIELHRQGRTGQAIDAYTPPRGDDYDNAAVLADPAWHRVVEAADQARSRLLAIAIDEGEKEVLRGGA